MIKHISGAKWWKFDFHNHTPKSFDFGRGDEAEKNMSARDFLLKYMEKEIDCIAITDHNSGLFINEAKQAYTELKSEQPEGFRELSIFPGVELTVNNGIHLIAIFDLSKTSEDIAQIIGECRYQGDQGDSNGVTSESLETVIEIINRKNGITIPAHVDDAAGLFTLQSGPTLKQTLKFNKDNLLALELINKDFDFPDIYKQAKLNLASIVGSDSHKSDEIGRYYTWVKMSSPSIEALKLALHDGEDGVLRYDEIDTNPNTITNRYFIKSLTVSSGYKAGNGTPLETKFSPWLTSVIGGRGTGKSTILNYIRILLDRVTEMPNDVQAEFDKFNKIGSKTSTGMLRDNTTITAEIIKDGKLHKLSWSQNLYSLQTWNTVTQSWSESVTITNVKELFPIQIFSQKELYALTNNPSKLIELIDSQFDKQTWIEEKKALDSEWLSKRLEKRKLEEILSVEGNLRASLSSTADKITVYESSEYKDTLNKYNDLNKIKNFMTTITSKVSEFNNEVDKLKNTIPDVNPPDDILELVDEDTLSYITSMNDTIKRFEENFNVAITLVDPYRENLQNQLQDLPWFNAYNDSKTAYNEITEQITELGSETYEELIERRSTLARRLEQIDEQKETLSELNENLSQLYASILAKEKELREKRLFVIDRWKSLADTDTPMLTIELDPMGDDVNANYTFRQLIRKEGSQYASYILDVKETTESKSGVIGNILSSPAEERWDKRQAEIDLVLSSTEANTNGLDLRLAKHIDSLKSNTPEDIDRLMIWFPEDKLTLKFNKQGETVNIDTGSAGERTAAMLGLLLALNTTPLIVDQPEDDLDTRLISNFVVTGFKTLKKNRQLVIVTHNPNITVNANSDNIVHMNYSSGQIIVSANDALQNKEIRNAVCDVMEGGKDALDKRYFRISRALK